MSSSSPTPGMVRIGDRERNQATECLQEHMATGRLDQAEFEQRIEAALSARYADDLRPLFIDLPAPRPDLPSVRNEQAAGRPVEKPVPTAKPVTAEGRNYRGRQAATAVMWVVAIVACVASGWHLWWLLFVPLVMGGTCGGHRPRDRRFAARQSRWDDRQLRWDDRQRRFESRSRRLEQRFR